MHTHIDWNAVAAIAAVIGLLFTVYFSYRSMRFSYETMTIQRKVLTQQATENFSLALRELSPKIDALFPEFFHRQPLNPTRVMAAIQNVEDRYVVLNYFNLCEALARGVATGAYDKEIVKTARRTVLIRAYLCFQPFIQAERAKEPGTPYWKELEDLVVEWCPKGDLAPRLEP